MVRIVLICALVILVLGQLVFAGASRRHNLYRGFQNESNWVQFVPEDEEFAAKIPKEMKDGLTEKAIDCTRNIRFFPAEKDGKPVSVHMMLEYYFNLF